jgi:hypothetical protein
MVAGMLEVRRVGAVVEGVDGVVRRRFEKAFDSPGCISVQFENEGALYRVVGS